MALSLSLHVKLADLRPIGCDSCVPACGYGPRVNNKLSQPEISPLYCLLQWNLGIIGTPYGLWKTVLNSEVVLFLRSISMYRIGLETEVAVLNSQVVLICQVVLKAGFTVF